MGQPVEPPVPLASQFGATAHVFAERLDDRITVGGDDGHHLQRARRVRVGETVTVADGYGRWRAYDVTRSKAGEVDLVATTLVAREPPITPRLTVACSLIKSQNLQLAVQKLTELGVDRVMVVEAARSVVHWDDTKAGAALARLERVAREAAMQSRRARVPVIDGPVPSSELVRLSGVVLASPDGPPASRLAAPAGGEWIVVVGPEGGFDADELGQFSTAERVGVGPFVLRAETAAIAAAAALAGCRTISPHLHEHREW